MAALEVGSESETPISKPITGESAIVKASPWCDDCQIIHSIPRKNIETIYAKKNPSMKPINMPISGTNKKSKLDSHSKIAITYRTETPASQAEKTSPLKRIFVKLKPKLSELRGGVKFKCPVVPSIVTMIFDRATIKHARPIAKDCKCVLLAFMPMAIPMAKGLTALTIYFT